MFSIKDDRNSEGGHSVKSRQNQLCGFPTFMVRLREIANNVAFINFVKKTWNALQSKDVLTKSSNKKFTTE